MPSSNFTFNYQAIQSSGTSKNGVHTKTRLPLLCPKIRCQPRTQCPPEFGRGYLSGNAAFYIQRSKGLEQPRRLAMFEQNRHLRRRFSLFCRYYFTFSKLVLNLKGWQIFPGLMGLNNHFCYTAGNFFLTARALIGYFEVT